MHNLGALWVFLFLSVFQERKFIYLTTYVPVQTSPTKRDTVV